MSRQFQFKLVLLGTSLHFRLPLDGERLMCVVQARVRWASPRRCSQQALSRSLKVNFICRLVLRFVKDQFDDYRESTIGGWSSPSSLPSCPALEFTSFLASRIPYPVCKP